MLRLALIVLWPSFLVAAAAEGVFFSLFEPQDLLAGGAHPELSPLGVYTAGFFFFWLCCSLAGLLSCVLARAQSRPAP